MSDDFYLEHLQFFIAIRCLVALILQDLLSLKADTSVLKGETAILKSYSVTYVNTNYLIVL